MIINRQCVTCRLRAEKRSGLLVYRLVCDGHCKHDIEIRKPEYDKEDKVDPFDDDRTTKFLRGY